MPSLGTITGSWLDSFNISANINPGLMALGGSGAIGGVIGTGGATPELTIAGMKVPKDTFNNDYKAKPRTFWEVLLDDKEVY